MSYLSQIVGASIFLGALIGIFVLSYLYNMMAMFLYSGERSRMKKFLLQEGLVEDYLNWKKEREAGRRSKFREWWDSE